MNAVASTAPRRTLSGLLGLTARGRHPGAGPVVGWAVATCPPDVEARLRSSRIAWLSTTGEDGFPGLVPIWFVWDGRTFLIFSKPHARKVRNITANPRVVLAIGEPEDDFDVQLVQGTAELVDRHTRELLPATLGAKYSDWLDVVGLDLEEFAATYAQPIRVTPTRFLPWRGRTWLGIGARPAALTAPA